MVSNQCRASIADSIAIDHVVQCINRIIIYTMYFYKYNLNYSIESKPYILIAWGCEKTWALDRLEL